MGGGENEMGLGNIPLQLLKGLSTIIVYLRRCFSRAKYGDLEKRALAKSVPKG
jgi:hypothetical protein